MRGVTLCDICKQPMSYRKYKIKAKYQFSDANVPKRLDICDDCWDEMRSWIQYKMKNQEVSK